MVSFELDQFVRKDAVEGSGFQLFHISHSAYACVSNTHQTHNYIHVRIEHASCDAVHNYIHRSECITLQYTARL